MSTHSTPKVILRTGREKPVLNHHPWIFSGAIDRVQGDPAPGDIVQVVDKSGKFLARGYINQHSQIVVRLLTWDEAEDVGTALWRQRMARAIEHRQVLAQNADTDAYRLIHAESDLLPGLIVDRYGDDLVLQALTAGIDCRKRELVELLAELLAPRGIYERSDVDVREKERLASETGTLWGEEPPTQLDVVENGHRFGVDIKHGQKTGFYLDQRDNRARLVKYCAGHSVLNAFAYSGAFAVYAAAAGATQTVNIDTSANALALARANLESNGLVNRNDEYIEGDVFAVLRAFRNDGRRFDLIILDPPKFAYSRSHVQKACRGYKDINLLAMQLLRPSGILFTMSCSGVISQDLFQKVVFGASVDAERDVQVIERLAQAADHPVLLTFPEGEYLKGLVCRVL
jgi:23S rRNA (cytosine1962-C5)-methyltransferase